VFNDRTEDETLRLLNRGHRSPISVLRAICLTPAFSTRWFHWFAFIVQLICNHMWSCRSDQTSSLPPRHLHVTETSVNGRLTAAQITWKLFVALHRSSTIPQKWGLNKLHLLICAPKSTSSLLTKARIAVTCRRRITISHFWNLPALANGKTNAPAIPPR
jgi:hypothetical protein